MDWFAIIILNHDCMSTCILSGECMLLIICSYAIIDNMSDGKGHVVSMAACHAESMEVRVRIPALKPFHWHHASIEIMIIKLMNYGWNSTVKAIEHNALMD